jgi:hypothetical protein
MQEMGYKLKEKNKIKKENTNLCTRTCVKEIEDIIKEQ